MHDVDFVPLLIITTLAFLIPLITIHLKTINVPVVVGEIVCGMIIGKSGFDIIEIDAWLHFLSIFGFTFLMFLSGMEIDLSFLKKRRETLIIEDKQSEAKEKSHDPFMMGSKVFVLTLLSALAVSYVLFTLQLISHPLFLALILSTTSVGIVVPTLKELGISNGIFGQDLLFSSLVADFMTMLFISVYVAKISSGLSLDLLLILLIFVIFVVLYRLSHYLLGKTITIRTLLQPSMQRIEIKTRAAFAIMIFFIVLSQKIGIEIILGAFLAGFLISLLSEEGDLTLLHEKLNAVGFGFFIPLFFIMVGVRFDLRPLIENPKGLILLPVFLLAAYFVKIIPCVLLKKHYTKRNAFAAGILLASRLTLIIAAADIGISLNIISSATYSIIILVAVISSTISPVLFYRIQHVVPR